MIDATKLTATDIGRRVRYWEGNSGSYYGGVLTGWDARLILFVRFDDEEESFEMSGMDLEWSDHASGQ